MTDIENKGETMGLINTREELIGVVAAMGLTGNWVEIGVQSGVFARHMLLAKPRRLYMVDAWRQFEISKYRDTANVPIYRQLECMAQAFQAVHEFNDRAVMIRDLSVNAAEIFADGFFDFVFIDANHTYEGVRADLLAWYPKLKSGGVFAGHDYVDSAFNGGAEFGVKRAVDEFAKSLGALNSLKATNENWPTWFMVKP